MKRPFAFDFIIIFLILELQILGSDQVPLTTRNSLMVDEEGVKYLETEMDNETVASTKSENNTHFDEDYAQLESDEALQRLRKQIILAKRTQRKIFTHDPEDILFMLTALILLCFHLFFLDTFLRLTRTRFQTNSRYQYVSTVHLFLAFLVCVVYFLLILLHYRDSQYCG